MIPIPFFLESKNKEASSLSFMTRFDGKLIKYAIGVSIITRFWDTNKYRVRLRKEYPEAGSINKRLDEWEKLIRKVLYKFAEKLVTPNKVSFQKAIQDEIEARHKSSKITKEFKSISYQSKPVYLDEDEINTIFDLPLSGYLDRARDHLIIGCRTALRVSDYEKVNYSVDGDLIIVSETDKTKEPVYIPIHWQVKKTLEKYDGSLPPIISEQKLRDYLKIVCEKAGITKEVFDNRQGYRRKGETCQKYELITTHTGRRSCLTNMYFAGFDLYFLMTISGHTKMDTLLRYIGVTRKVNALTIKDDPYFKEPKLDEGRAKVKRI